MADSDRDKWEERYRYYEDAVIPMEEAGERREGAVIRMIVEKQAVKA